MPRETIRVYSDEDPNIFDIKVGWEKDRHMQLGLESFDHRSLAWILWENSVERIGVEVRKAIETGSGADESEEFHVKLMDGTLKIMDGSRPPLTDEQLGKAILNILDVATAGPTSSLWTSPSRHEVNELIRLLRKARDSAFGRDE